MKAIVYHQYGSPEELQLAEVDQPVPGGHEVLIKVHAASINALDWRMLRADPFLVRLTAGFFKPKNKILGADVAGTVEAVGKNVSEFKPGDEVFGASNRLGTLAEYVAVDPDTLALKPAGITFEEAAAVPVAAVTALQSIRAGGQISPGEKVLINGASGGVGTFSVLIAKSYGAEVTAVCSSGKTTLVKSLGADHVIDYTKEDFSKGGPEYDLVIDNVGNYSVSDYQRVLRPGGRCIIVGFTSMGRLLRQMLGGPLASMTGRKKVRVMGSAQVKSKDLDFLAELLETGRMKPEIEQIYALEEVRTAMTYLDTGHAKGKLVIAVKH